MKPSQEISVAVIDDDESVCRSLGRLLRAQGIASVSYLSAEAFLRHTPRPPFDCLVVDVQLAGTSGMDLHRRLVAAGETTPVIFLTGHDNPDEQKQAIAAGCAAYFRKTDAGADVIGAIRRAATP